MGGAVEPAIGIEAFGAIQADLAAGVPRADALAQARLTDAQLLAVTQHWLQAMGQEVRRGRMALSQRYAKAYVARRPELLRDPEGDVDRLAVATAAANPPPAAAAAHVEPSPAPAAPEAPRALPSYLREPTPTPVVAPMSSPAMRPAVVPAVVPASAARYAAADPDATLPPLAPTGAPTMPFAPKPVAARLSADVEETLPIATPFRSADVPFAASPPAAPSPTAPPSSAPPESLPFASSKPRGNALGGTAMALDIPASFKALPFDAATRGTQPRPPSSPAIPSVGSQPLPSQPLSTQPRPPSSQPVPSQPVPSQPVPSQPVSSAKSALAGTAMALDIPVSFKAIPFSTDKPPSSTSSPVRSLTPSPSSQAAPPSLAGAAPPGASPSSSSASSARAPAPPPPTRDALTGTAMAIDVPAHLKKIPIGGASIPVVPPLPPLEHYVRMGVELAATAPAQVETVLARERWTRADWTHIDKTYRDRIAREPDLRQAFQTVLTQERARRSTGPR